MKAVFILLALAAPTTDGSPRFEAQQLDPHVGNVCYAVTTADVDGDKKLDVVAVTEDAVVWFANPSWRKEVILQGGTARDNVCIQPRDIDGDGRVDFALGAGWRPPDTQKPGTLQWLGRDDRGRWQVHPLPCDEPSIHRIRWGAGRTLYVAPLQGRGTHGPDWGQGQGVRVLAYTIPDRPAEQAWPVEVIDDALHTIHNLQVVDVDGDGREDLLLAAWEGVFLLKKSADGRWSRTKLGSGNQEARPSKGASEIKLGRLADGRRYIATIEPWHGFQVVVYTPPKSGDGAWDRRVLDEPVAWGHAVWCADLDGDRDEELIIGQRDPNRDPKADPRGPGVRVYDPKAGSDPLAFTRHIVDDGGMATEDLVAADLDGDGRPDVVAGGRATHNVKVYWNRGSTPAEGGR